MTQPQKKLSALDQALLDTIKAGTWNNVMKVIRAGANIHTLGPRGVSVTTMVSQDGEFGIVRDMMDFDITVLKNTTIPNSTPFIWAAIYNNEIAVEMAHRAPYVLHQQPHEGVLTFARRNNIDVLCRLAAVDPSILAQTRSDGLNTMQLLSLHRNYLGIGQLEEINPNARRLSIIPKKMLRDKNFIINSINNPCTEMLGMLLGAGFAKPNNFDALLANSGISMSEIIPLIP